MTQKTNSHVERLHRYLPFSPSHDQIYEEFQRSGDSLNLDTRALEYLTGAMTGTGRIVVLTGDAGHGKTHLCRRLLQDQFGYSEDESRQLINERCNGDDLIPPSSGATGTRPIRVFKDLSEFTVEIAAAKIESLLSDESIALICANEGRLRAVLDSQNAGDVCARLSEAVRASFSEGWVTRDGEIHVINLNHQSVSSGDDGSLVQRAIHEWLSGSRWRVCKDCESSSGCPILRNKELLAGDSLEQVVVRRGKLKEIYATLERLGYVVTIREMLMSIAYLITGGLKCADVHSRLRTRKSGWQYQYAFYNLLFSKPSRHRSDHLARIPILAELSRIDPGHRSIRDVDEGLVNEQSHFKPCEIDLQFELKSTSGHSLIDASQGIDEIIGNPRNHKERLSESDFVTLVVRCLRRRAFFDRVNPDDASLNRLGFEYGDSFLEILSGETKPQRMAALKNRIIAGLHTIQGLQLGLREATLHLVDPAFGSATSHAAIIARRIPGASIKLISQSSAWAAEPGKREARRMAQALDWLDRTVLLRIEQDEVEAQVFPMDLLIFDCIARAANGYVAEEFYGHEVRRVANFLGRLAEQGAARDRTIGLALRGELRSISIDNGVIQVSGGIG